jgi:hypothetical protein
MNKQDFLIDCRNFILNAIRVGDIKEYREEYILEAISDFSVWYSDQHNYSYRKLCILAEDRLNFREFENEFVQEVEFNIAYAPKEWLDNLDFQLSIARQKLYETTPRTFSPINPFREKERKTYTALEQLESSSVNTRS